MNNSSILHDGMRSLREGARRRELTRTAELFVSISAEQGVYFALAFLRDSSYTMTDIEDILPILLKTKGSDTRGTA